MLSNLFLFIHIGFSDIYYNIFYIFLLAKIDYYNHVAKTDQ